MSEPAAVYLQIEIARPALVAHLAAAPPHPSAWSDWSALGTKYADLSDWDAARDKICATAGRLLRASNRASGRLILEQAELPYLSRCTYDEPAGLFTLTCLTYSENLYALVAFFTLARGFAAAMSEGASGVAHAYTALFEYGDDEDVVAVMALAAGTSRFLDRTADAAEVDRQIALAKPLFDEIAAIAEAASWSAGPPPIDELDAMI